MNVKYLAALVFAAMLAGCAAVSPLEPPSDLSASNSDTIDPPHPPVIIDPPPMPLPPVEDGGGTHDRPLMQGTSAVLLSNTLKPEFPMPPIEPSPSETNGRR